VLTRIVVGLIGLAILLPSLFKGGELAVEIIVAVALVICLDEYARMAFDRDRWPALSWLLATGAAVYVAVTYVGGAAATAVPALVAMATLSWCTFRPGSRGSGDDDGPCLEEGASAAGRYFVGLAWIVGLLPMLLHLRRLDEGLAWLLTVLAIAWCGDTGAYFAGRSFGRRKLYELVSPKKTWEGAIGGVAASILGVFLVRMLWHPTLEPIDCILLGALGSSAGVVGDLSESLMKRAYRVKDSGWIMPGHGGLLDRIDSVLFVAPMVYAYATLWLGYTP
jgi:phosphatidate cytidylyltransferase